MKRFLWRSARRGIGYSFGWMIESPRWLGFCRRWGPRIDVEESSGKSSWKLQQEPLVGSFWQLWQLRWTLPCFAGKSQTWKVIVEMICSSCSGRMMMTGLMKKKAGGLRGLRKFLGVSQLCKASTRKPGGTYQNGTLRLYHSLQINHKEARKNIYLLFLWSPIPITQKLSLSPGW